MPRIATKRSVRITITTTEQVANALDGLVTVGLHGSNRADAAERLVCEGLRNDLKRRRTALLNPEEKP